MKIYVDGSGKTGRYCYVIEGRAQRLFEEKGLRDKVVIKQLEEGENIAKALNDHLVDKGIDPTRAALAVGEEDVENLKALYEGAAGDLSATFNSLVVNTQQMQTILNQDGMLPAMNMMSIMLRLAAEEKPTLFSIGCSEATVGTLAELQATLGRMLNFISVQAIEIGRRVEEFINSVGKIEIAL